VAAVPGAGRSIVTCTRPLRSCTITKIMRLSTRIVTTNPAIVTSSWFCSARAAMGNVA
jgi:hypothetical protein